MYFYLNPYKLKEDNFHLLYKKCWFVIIIVTFFYSILQIPSVKLSADCCDFLSYKSFFLLVNLITYLFKIIFTSIFLTTIISFLFKIIKNVKISFNKLFKIFFISSTVVIFSYLIEIVDIFLYKLFLFHLFNPFNYSLANVLGIPLDCTNPFVSFLGKVDLLLFFVAFYSYVILYNLMNLDKKQLIKLLLVTFTILVLVKSMIPCLIKTLLFKNFDKI